MKVSKAIPIPMHRAQGASIVMAPFLAVLVLLVSPVSTTWFGPSITQPVAAESQPPAAVAPSGTDQLAPASRRIPLTFIENVGQSDERVHFQAHNGNTTLFLADDALWVSLTGPLSKPDPLLETETLDTVDVETETNRGVNLKLSFVDANPHPRLEPFDRLKTQVSFFIGNDPSQWQTNAPAWGGVRYVDLYSGIDLEITSQNGQLVQRLVVREHSSLRDVHLRVEGVDNLALESNHLRLTTPLGDFALPLLTVEGATQKTDPVISVLDDVYQVSTPFASTSPLAFNATLASPPILLYSTYLGGSGNDRGYDIALDTAGNVYITGLTSSTGFPTTPGAYDTSYGGHPSDVFVSKLSADGSTLLYSTYLGGNSEDGGYGIAVDSAGSVYIAGATYSTDFPTSSGALDTTLSGGRDAFAAKLNAAGDNLIYSTYLGGGRWDYGFCLAIDDTGNAYVGGFTHGSFPITSGAAQTTFGGSGDGFVVKLGPDGSTLLYSTYLGGYSWEGIDGIAIDNAGNAYLAASTHSTDFPTTPGAWDRVCDNCQTNFSTDAAVAKLNADGSQFIYSTLVGGADAPGGETFRDVAIDSAGNAYLTGYTHSTDFPTTTNALQPSFGGGQQDAVVTKLNPDGSALLYSTYLGDSGTDRGFGITIDGLGNAYIIGHTDSTNFPTAVPLQATNGGGQDVFVVELNADGSALLYGTYLGGSGDDQSGGIAINNSTSDIYLTGFTGSIDYPTTTNAYDVSFNGGTYDAFVTIQHAGYAPEALELTKTLNNSTSVVRVGEVLSFTIALTNNTSSSLTNVTLVDTYNQNVLGYVGATPPEDMVDTTNGVITWTNIAVPPILPGQTRRFTGSFTAEHPQINVVNSVEAREIMSELGALPDIQATAQLDAIVGGSTPILKSLSPPNSIPKVGTPVTFTHIISNDGAALITTLPLTDVYDPAFLQFNLAIPAPTVSGPPGLLVWPDLTSSFGAIPPFQSVAVTTVFTAMAQVSQTVNQATVENARDQFNNELYGGQALVPITIIGETPPPPGDSDQDDDSTVTPPTSSPPATQEVNCWPWLVVLPPLSVPGATIECQASFGSILSVPSPFRFLGHSTHVTIKDAAGNPVTQFNPPFNICFRYAQSELDAVGGNPGNFLLQIFRDGAWQMLSTTPEGDPSNQVLGRVCAPVDHLTLFALFANDCIDSASTACTQVGPLASIRYLPATGTRSVTSASFMNNLPVMIGGGMFVVTLVGSVWVVRRKQKKQLRR
jgi:uncharacterized repeat protein (TIGR01451 family)